MKGHKLCFYVEICIIIPKLFLLLLLIRSARLFTIFLTRVLREKNLVAEHDINKVSTIMIRGLKINWLQSVELLMRFK